MAPIPVYVEAWDPSYGASAQLEEDADSASQATIVEDGGRLSVHRGVHAPPDLTIAFVDGIRRTEGFLSFSDPDTGDLVRGIAGAYGVGAAMFRPGRSGEYDHLMTQRLAVACAGHAVEVGPVAGGWNWISASTQDAAVEKAEAVIHEQMRQGETTLARDLGATGALTVVDGNLNYVRSIEGSFIGCVKTHRRIYLQRDDRERVARLGAGERTSLFTVRQDCYACYLRLAPRGPHHAPWHGIVRIEVPQAIGRAAAIRLADLAAGTLPRFAGVEGRDPRAPQNLRPIGALERRLRQMLGPAESAMRALRSAVAAHHPTAGGNAR
jgi:uncharacterized protein